MARLSLLGDRIRRAKTNRRVSPDQARHAELEAQNVSGWLHQLYEETKGHLSDGQVAEAQRKIDRIVDEIQWVKSRGY